MIELSSVTFRYPKSTSDALSNISLCIPHGSFFALIGPNGAGKTTLLRLLCGRLGSFQGSIKIEDALCNSEGFLNAEKYGVLLENPGVYPKLSIREYLQYFTGFYGFGEDSWRENGDMLNRCKLLADRLNLPALDKRLETLSLGNRQKVQIVRALLHNPKLLILDEPVANLDPISRDSVWHLLDEWRQETHGTAIVCSHVLAEMDEWATDYAIIDCGHVLKSGRVADIGADVASFKINAAGVSLEQIRAALAAAGISADVNSVQTSLSKIYRDLIH
ncbi:ABC transporter ATP-binding protein [Fibrobacter sp. UWB12]|uniref:ABC transporter ATP-binding protein n=1 Tax=Fibrobacter sp. UWB12 TaxID=1896203 RepID=UPI00091F75AE|nr:ABC transporter ATP-binding protein [Fibrobacter sp. UWB12]SHK24985.1 ABC-2 type transport system ATP-binding protein [Fibrobacter sp. UWB12]